MRIWDIAIKQPVFMTMILLAGLVMGLFSYSRIPVDLFPDITIPVIVVTTGYPGANPQEVEDTVTDVLEEEFSALAGLESVTSSTFEGLSQIILEFDFDTDVNDAAQRVQEKLNVVGPSLPTDARDPVVQRFDPTAQPIMQFGVTDATNSLSPTELRKWVEEQVQGPLQRLPGVASAEVRGGDIREIQVLLDLKAMEARRITSNQVIAALQSENLNIPIGSLENDTQSIPVRAPGNFDRPEDLENVVISYGSSPIYLRDVATVVDGFADRDSITRVNGQESISVIVQRQSGTNTVQVADVIKEEIAKIQDTNPDINLTVASDASEAIEDSANGAVSDLLWGMLLASMTVLFFFRNLRNTILTVIGLPIIMISTLFFMDLMGLTLNQISLLALALVTGLVIDDGIVVRENILRWLDRGYPAREAASRATAQVILPVLATTATILAVFLPIGFAEGIAGQFFSAFGLTVSIAVIVSTFEALTLAPMLGARFFRPSNKNVIEGKIDESAAQESAGSGLLDRLYGGMIHWSLHHRWLTILLGLLVVAGTLYVARTIEVAFAPSLDEGEVEVTIELPPSTPLSVTEREAIAVERVFMSHPDAAAVFASIGTASSTESASFVVKMREGARTADFIDDLRPALIDAPKITFAQPEGGPGGNDPLVGNKDVVIQLVGSNVSYAEVGEAALMVMDQLRSVPGYVDVETSYDAGNPEIQVQIDRERAAELGLSTAQIGSTLRTLINGTVASNFRGEGDEAEIVVRLKPEDRTNVEDILSLNIMTPRGQLIPLRTIVAAQFATGPAAIQRLDRQPTVGIGGNASGRTMPQVRDDVLALVDTTALPEGISIKQGGDAERQADAFGSLFAALALSVIFIYMALASQFGSFLQPLLIMLALPLSVNGALLALVIASKPFDITAFIGLILLMGLSTKNSILLVDFANQARANGLNATEAMEEAGRVRLRPILMTAISLILAMVPVVLAFSAGGEFRQSMGIAIMGGMITSTLLTLFIVPVFYSLVVGFQERIAARRKKRKERKAAQPRAELQEVQQGIGD